MKKLISILVPVLFATVMMSTTACNDDKDVTPPFEALLTAYPWKFDKVTMAVEDTFMTSLLEEISTMMRGTLLTFNKDHTHSYEIDPNMKGTWSLAGDGRTLLLIEDDYKRNIQVLTLTETKLEISERNDYYSEAMVTTYVRD